MSVTYPRGIGLLGGTFDPIHNGHLALAREALRTLRLQRIELLVASALRVRMAEDALAHEAHMRVNLTEVLRDGATYTIDTLKVLRDELGPSEPLVLIIGCDQWANFHTWKHWRDFTDYCSVAVCRRGGEYAGPNIKRLPRNSSAITPAEKSPAFRWCRIWPTPPLSARPLPVFPAPKP